MFRIILMATSLLASSTAHASTSAEWGRFHAKVGKSCRAASGLQRTRSGEIVGFDDSLGKVVTLVTGMAPQTRQRPSSVTMLCIYDQRSGRTWTTEARGWRSPDRAERR